VRRTFWLWIAMSCSAGDDVPSPVITTILPDRAMPGTSILVSGFYFCGQPDADDEEAPFDCHNIGSVMFDGAPTSSNSYEDHQIMVIMPELGAGVVSVQVAVSARRSNIVELIVEPVGD
jgi:hypothetical protein